ncbi:hypothetical protein [Burkholderia gladioli]|uniref:hypothetical protein n=1 Tax=Burkholderia gladioli TaxID=28095 RepID=UPI00163F8276|nr:hypothetical protein [Burkholderia gladioli]
MGTDAQTVVEVFSQDFAGTSAHSEKRNDLSVRSTSKELFWADIALKGSDWTTTLSEMHVTMTETGPYTFDSLVHFVVDGPVRKADNYNWVDVQMQFVLYSQSNAFVTSFDFQFSRNCGRYLLEPSAIQCNSTVAYPVRNTDHATLNTRWMTRVTWC